MSVGSQATNSCISYQILIRRATVNFLPDNIALFAPQSPLHTTHENFFLWIQTIFRFQIEIDLNLGSSLLPLHCIDLSVLEKIWISNFFQKLRMMLFEKERYLREKLGDEWRESRDKSRQAFLALLNSELPAAIPTTWEQREFDKHRLAWPGLTVPVRRVVLQ